MNTINNFILKYVTKFEMLGVLMRIFSFSLVSWQGEKSPYLFIWIFNAIDAIILSWCSILKKDKAYIMLNLFWILVSLVGVARVMKLI